jgi:hypothetical protein
MSWVGLGQGSKMAGSNMVVLYASSDGENVTVSPRLGKNHDQPLYDNSADFTLLAGSGISNGTMTANIKCSNCNSWSGGSMDFTASDASWIYAYKNGAGITSDAQDATIKEHSKYGDFMFKLTQARGGSSSNPFTDPAYSVTDNIPLTGDGEAAYPDTLVTAHGVVACATFVVFILGAIIIRLASFSGVVWVHAAAQVVGFIGYVAAVGMGIYMATHGQGWVAHNVIGLVLFGLLFMQPVTGLIHHRVFKRTFTRSVSSWIHLTTGRVVILVGLINGGLGLQLAGHSAGAYIAHGVVAGVIALMYIVAIVVGERKKSRTRKSSDAKAEVAGSEMG